MSNLLKTVRSVRIGPFAVFDFASSFAGMALLAPKIGLSREMGLWLALPAGVAAHAVFGIDTPFNQMVVGENPNRLAQAAVALCLAGAVRSYVAAKSR